MPGIVKSLGNVKLEPMKKISPYTNDDVKSLSIVEIIQFVRRFLFVSPTLNNTFTVLETRRVYYIQYYTLLSM